MDWQTPSFTEIDMSAEIGGYQGEGEPTPWPPYVAPEPPAANADEA